MRKGTSTYAVRTVGPGGLVRYLRTEPITGVLIEDDRQELADTFDDRDVAEAVEQFYRRKVQGQSVLIDVVDLDAEPRDA